MNHMDVAELKQKQNQNESFELIDVREKEEYDICHISGSKLIPLSQLPIEAQNWDRSKTYYLLCKMGGRSARACEWMMANGFEDVTNIEGGIMAWAEDIDTTMPIY